MFSSARQAEIIRSNQKDDYYSSYIRGSLSEIVQAILGPGLWIRCRQEVDLIANIGYFGLTTFAGYQTLGEEYVNIVQVNDTKRALPNKYQRAAMIILQVTTPYLLDKLLTYCERQLQNNPRLTFTPEGRQLLLRLIPQLRSAITLIHRCHLTLFYMRGVFYHIAKRTTGIHYILVRRGVSEESRSNYNILGWLSVIQLALAFLHQLYKLYQQRTTESKKFNLPTKSSYQEHTSGKETSSESAPVDLSLRCDLCLENRKDSTATPCGHLFCWTCITEWCSAKPECPLCREKFEMSRLIILQNFDPS